MGLPDKGLISESSSEGLDSTPQQGRHGPRRLRQLLETAVRAETRRGEGGMKKVEEKVEEIEKTG